MDYIMALDQGTTSSRCILFDRSGRMCATAQKEFRQIYPHPGWVEHDADEIWETTLEVSRAALSQLGVDATQVAAIGITNQRETTILWDRHTGMPIANAIVWQCRRTSGAIEKLVAQGHGEGIRARTGLQPDAYFSASKIQWLLDSVPGARARAERGELLFGTVDTWLIWKLTGGRVHVTDHTNASRTLLYNIHELKWDEEQLRLFNIPKCILPEVKPSSCVYGETEPGLYGAAIPIAGAAGDQQCALFGQCCFEPGQMKNTYGTGCFMLMNTGEQIIDSKNGLVTSIAASLGNRVSYVLEGSVFVAGAAIQWLRDELKVLDSAAQSQAYAEQVPDTAGAYVVPAFTGLGAPYWSQNARGMIVGVTRGFSRAHLVRATLESLAYQVYDVTGAMERDSGIHVTELRVDGGACANDFLMQFQADLIGGSVVRPKCIETTALGAAYLAGLAVGYWSGLDEVRQNWAVDRVFRARETGTQREERLAGWRRAVKCALMWAEE